MKRASNLEDLSLVTSVERPRILVVDDDPGARKTLSLILERKGFDVVTAGTAREALEKADDGFVNVGLLDIRLPDGKGIELLKPLHERHPGMESIVVTGYASTETAMRALNAGATAYITKPLNIDEVLAEVRRIVDTQRLVAEKRETEEQVEHVNAVLRAIRSVNQLIVREKDPDRLIQEACEILIETRGYLSALVVLQDDHGKVSQVASAGLGPRTEELERFLSQRGLPDCGKEALAKQDVIVTKASPNACTDCPLAKIPGVRSEMAAPLRHGGKLYGTLIVSTSLGFAPDEETSLFREVTNDIAMGLHSIELEEQRENYIRELRFITDTVVTGSRIQDVDALCSLIAEAVHRMNEGSYVSVSLYDRDLDGIRIRAIEGLGGEIDRIFDILGADPREGSAHPEEVAEALDPTVYGTGKLERVSGGLHDALVRKVPRQACREAEKALDLEDVYTVGFALGDEPRGSITVLVPEGEELKHASAIETLTSHFSVLMQQRQAEQARKESEARYRTLFDNSSDALFIHDLEGRMLEVNQIACHRLGYERDQLLNKMVIDIDPSAYAANWSERIQDIEQRGHVVFQSSHVRSDDTEIPVEVSSRLIDYGGRRAILSAARDISKRLEMEKQLHQQERLAAVGQLAGGIAHDFRNFLTTIILYAGMPLGRPDLPSSTREALEVISREAQQASDLVQQILDFSGRSAMEAQPVDLVAFVEEAVDILRQTIPESINVSLAIEPEESIVEADPTRIQQMLMNLALNARDAMMASPSASNGEGSELGIALSKIVMSPDAVPPVPRMEPGEWVRVTVSDTGTGMTEEVKDRIFEPFFTTKERGEGTGLGLAQVYGIVQQHHGHIDVETKLGEGTAFHVYLPIHAAAVGELEEGPGSLPEGAGETILLVEDQENLREAGRGMLTSLGYRVVTAANGREALDLLTGLQVDAVVTDVVMPEMGGKALMGELRQRAPQLPVVAVTGYTMKEEISDLRELGFFEVLQKPFDALSLAQGVRRALDIERG